MTYYQIDVEKIGESGWWSVGSRYERKLAVDVGIDLFNGNPQLSRVRVTKVTTIEKVISLSERPASPELTTKEKA